MTVKRIVTNIATSDVSLAKRFYCDALELDLAMDLGWIHTYVSTHSQPSQLSVASEGGSGTPVPDLSIEVDNLDEVYSRMQSEGFNITYQMVEEPWGVRRFYVEDPFGKLVNVLEHSDN